MNRRLYFLFPDETHARHLIDTLPDAGIPVKRIHALTRDGGELRALPAATPRQRGDAGLRVERWLWGANLGLFGLALIGGIWALLAGPLGWPAIAIATMLATFIGGLIFTHVPNVHLPQLRDALAHGEVLVMGDVAKGRVHETEELVRRHHPEAVVGGVGWTVDAFGI